MKFSCYFFLPVCLLSCCLLSLHTPVTPEQPCLHAGSGLLGKAWGAAAQVGGRKETAGDDKLDFGRGTSQAPLPVHELQVFLLEAAVLLTISGCVLLQLRHPLLQKDDL